MTLEQIVRVEYRKKLCLACFPDTFHSIQELHNARQIFPPFYIISLFRSYWNKQFIKHNKFTTVFDYNNFGTLLFFRNLSPPTASWPHTALFITSNLTWVHGIIVNCTFEKQARVFSKVHLWNFKNYILSVLLRCDQEAFPLKSSHKLATWKGNSLHCFLADDQPMIMMSTPLFRPSSEHDKFNFLRKIISSGTIYFFTVETLLHYLWIVSMAFERQVF